MRENQATDDDAFGHWLSGFVDGEGCFFLGWNSYCSGAKRYEGPAAFFIIKLRSDDRPILDQIQSYWGAGKVTGEKATRGSRNSRSQSRFTVSAVPTLLDVVIPFFDRYELRAKKAGDFVIWRRGVELMARVQGEPRIWEPGARGHIPKWNPSRKREFQNLVDTLRDLRRFKRVDRETTRYPIQHPQVRKCSESIMRKARARAAASFVSLRIGASTMTTQNRKQRKFVNPPSSKRIKSSVSVDVALHARWSACASLAGMDRSAFAAHAIEQACKGVHIIDRRKTADPVNVDDRTDGGDSISQDEENDTE